MCLGSIQTAYIFLRFPSLQGSQFSAPIMARPTCCNLSEIKPLRLMLMLVVLAAFAASLPRQPVTVGLMTPVEVRAPGLFGR